jgi:hypothetical protein
VLAANSVTWSGCSTSAKCFPNSAVGAPAVQPFPAIGYNEAAWIAAGYQIENRNQCGGSQLNGGNVSNNPNKWLAGLALSPTNNQSTVLTRKTLLRTTCPIELSGTGIMKMPFDLAVVADGGFNASGRTIFQSTGGQILHWIVPAGLSHTIPNPCTLNPANGGGFGHITTDNQFATSSNINMLIYTPCNISFSNNSRHVGQIYARGAVSLNNRFNLTYRPVPVFGTTFSSGQIRNYKVEILFKRENAG